MTQRSRAATRFRPRGAAGEAVVPVLVMATVVGLDLATGPGSYFYPFLSVVPALAATTARPSVVLVAGLCGLPLRYLLAAYDQQSPMSYTDTAFTYNTLGLVAATLASALVARLRLRRERKLAAVSAVARAAQRAILVQPPETVADIRVAVRYYPVADHAELGGDLYEVQGTAHGVRAVIGDVAGKGLEAVRTAAAVLGSFREACHDEPGLAGVVARVERSLYRELHSAPFVTALFLQFGPDGVEFVHRGHEPPLLVTADGAVRELMPPDPGLPLGLGRLAGATAGPAAWRLPFGPGDMLVLVTDGVGDTLDRHGRPYPLPERAALLLGHGRGTDPPSAVAALGADVLRHAGRRPLSDDTLVVALARQVGSAPSWRTGAR